MKRVIFYVSIGFVLGILLAGGIPDVFGEPFDLTGTVFNDSHIITRNSYQLLGHTWSNDGLFLMTSNDINIDRYNVTTAFDVTTIDNDSIITFTTGIGRYVGIDFNNDGSKMYVIDSGAHAIKEFNLTTNYDITTAVLVNTFIVPDNTPTDISFNNDGSKIYIVGVENINVYEYTLASNYDLTTPTLSYTYSINTHGSTPRGIDFSTDGVKMFTYGQSSNRVIEYTLATGFDLSTASATRSLDIGSYVEVGSSLRFSQDGNSFYVLDTGSIKRIHQFNILASVQPTPVEMVPDPGTISGALSGVGEVSFIKNVGIAIPDHSLIGYTSYININDFSKVESVSLKVDITHSNPENLLIYLFAPDGRYVTYDSYNINNVVFTHYLTQFDGSRLDGSWKLLVMDKQSNNIGTLVSWELTILYDADKPIYQGLLFGSVAGETTSSLASVNGVGDEYIINFPDITSISLPTNYLLNGNVLYSTSCTVGDTIISQGSRNGYIVNIKINNDGHVYGIAYIPENILYSGVSYERFGIVPIGGISLDFDITVSLYYHRSNNYYIYDTILCNEFQYRYFYETSNTDSLIFSETITTATPVSNTDDIIGESGGAATDGEVGGGEGAPKVRAKAIAPSNEVGLIWTTSYDQDPTSFTIYRADGKYGTFNEIDSGITETSFDDTGLTEDLTYLYRVEAYYPVGESYNSTTLSTRPGGGSILQFEDFTQVIKHEEDNTLLLPINIRGESILNGERVTVSWNANNDLTCNYLLSNNGEVYTLNTTNSLVTQVDNRKSVSYNFNTYDSTAVNIYCSIPEDDANIVYVVRQNEIPLIGVIDTIKDSKVLGTDLTVVGFDILTYVAILGSMIAFNSRNEVMGVIASVAIITGMAVLGFIEFQTVMLSALITVVFIVITQVRKGKGDEQ